MFKYTRHTLKKLEGLFEAIGYLIRFEKGHFNSGYCILESKKVVVINRYFDLEAKINTMVEILSSIDPDPAILDPQNARLLKEFTWKKSVSSS